MHRIYFIRIILTLLSIIIKVEYAVIINSASESYGSYSKCLVFGCNVMWCSTFRYKLIFVLMSFDSCFVKIAQYYTIHAFAETYVMCTLTTRNL